MKVEGDEKVTVIITAEGREGMTAVLFGLAQLETMYRERGLVECEKFIHDASDLIGMLEGSRRPEGVVGLVIDGRAHE